MTSVRIRVARVPGLRELRKLLRRHPDKVVHIMIVLAVDNPQQWGNFKKHYKLEEIPWPVILGKKTT